MTDCESKLSKLNQLISKGILEYKKQINDWHEKDVLYQNSDVKITYFYVAKEEMCKEFLKFLEQLKSGLE